MSFFLKISHVLNCKLISVKPRISILGVGMISPFATVKCKYPGNIKIFGRIIAKARASIVADKGIIKIGKNFFLNEYSRIISFNQIIIGDNVTVAKFVTILDHDHKFNIQSGQMKFDGYRSKPVKIGNNVWIGDKATILKGVSIGNNVIVAANSVVVRDVPDNCIVGGSVSKIIKHL